MAVVDPTPVSSALDRLGGRGWWIVAAAVAVAVGCRLPFLWQAIGPDEAGYLIVGRQWHGAGTSLYGNFWVDRPPLLISIFRLAASMGGLTALRLIGCIAAALLVGGSAIAAGLIAGRRAAIWSAAIAAILTASPLLGGYNVNGELLAAPLVVAGIAAAVIAVKTGDARHGVGAAAISGLLAVLAVLVKQNFADAVVFGGVAFAVARWRGEITSARLVRIAVAFVAGAGLGLAAVAIWTISQGTSLSGVFYAMYPFRLKAGQVMAAGGSQYSVARLFILLGAVVISGLALLLLALLVSVRHRRDALWWALIATIAFDIASVGLGGSYWLHYLIELFAPVSIAVGVLAARVRRVSIRSIAVYAAVAGTVAWGVMLGSPQGSVATMVGREVGASSRPGDTIVNAYGSSQVVESSGLSSPYRYLWSLPVKTLDPKLHELNTVLEGPTAPTFLVTTNLSSWGLDSAATRAIVARDYRVWARICGRTVYLHKGVDRVAPVGLEHCGSVPNVLDAPVVVAP